MGECDHELDFAQRLSSLESRCKSNTHRLDRLEQITEAVQELAVSMKLLAEKQSQTAETVSRLDDKVSTLEAQPGKRWNSLVEKVILTIVAALVGFVLAHLGIA